MQSVRNENELPAPEVGAPPMGYLRCMANHRMLIETRTGAVFERADGADWKEQGYHVRLFANGRSGATPATAFCDLDEPTTDAAISK